jgi:hypothetical protein
MGRLDCWSHPASYIMGNGSAFPGVKRQGREADELHLHSPVRLFGVFSELKPETTLLSLLYVEYRAISE